MSKSQKINVKTVSAPVKIKKARVQRIDSIAGPKSKATPKKAPKASDLAKSTKSTTAKAKTGAKSIKVTSAKKKTVKDTTPLQDNIKALTEQLTEATAEIVRSQEPKTVKAATAKKTSKKPAVKKTIPVTVVKKRRTASNQPAMKSAAKPVRKVTTVEKVIPEKAIKKPTPKRRAHPVEVKIERSVHKDIPAPAPASKTEVREKTKKKHTIPTIIRVIFSIACLAGFAIFLNWYIAYRFNFMDAEATEAFIAEKPELYWYSAGILFCLMAVLAAATWRPILTMGISFVLASALTFINAQKMVLRNAPFLPEEIALADQAGNLAQFVDTWSVVRLAAGIVFVLVGAGMLEHFLKKVIGNDQKKMPVWSRYSLIPRVAFTALALGCSGVIVTPVLKRTTLEWVPGMKYVGWNQLDNYTDNGFVVGFLHNLLPSEIERPEQYNEETMKQLAEKYRAKKAADQGRKALGDAVQNIVVILDETFYDPMVITKYYNHTGGDVTPNLHQIFQKHPSGYMYSPEYGGNTANIEFEVQTGLSNFWANNIPYLNLVPKTSGLLGVATWGKTNDFGTTAVHSYDGSMYKRNIVYPLMGYDTFIDSYEMTYKEKEGKSENYNDRSVFNEVLDVIKENDSPQVVGVVTMQNHGPYSQADYSELQFLVDGGNFLLENNFQSIHYADEYLGEFLDALDELDEKTVVLWFGDHAAGILDKYIKSEDKVDRDTVHLTPYFIYTNFEVENEYDVKELAQIREELGIEIDLPRYLLQTIDLPITTPNCLQNSMYNLLNAEKPAKFYLLDELCEEMPILARSYYDGQKPEMTDILSEYELLNYDALAGKQYWNGD